MTNLASCACACACTCACACAGRVGRGGDIARAVRRAVWKRDGGRCTFVAPDGRRCGETLHLHFDHIDPFGRGGGTTVDNLRLRCATHDALAAREAYGDEHMARAIERARGTAHQPAGTG